MALYIQELDIQELEYKISKFEFDIPEFEFDIPEFEFDIPETELEVFYSEETKTELIYKTFINLLVNDILNKMYESYRFELKNSFIELMKSLKNSDIDVPYFNKNIKTYDLDSLEKEITREYKCNYDYLKKIFNGNIHGNIMNINELFKRHNKNIKNEIDNQIILINIHIDTKYNISLTMNLQEYDKNEFIKLVYETYKLWHDKLKIPELNEQDNFMDEYIDKIIDDLKDDKKIEKEIKNIYKLPNINCCKQVKKYILKKFSLYEINRHYKKYYYSNGYKYSLFISFNMEQMIIKLYPDVKIIPIC